MARSHSSTRWLQEHFTDPYVKRAQAEGWRSRAVFKLGELIDRGRLLKPGMVAVDLGAAPGGWSQMMRERLGADGRVIAMDMLPMQGIAGVDFVLGDFRQPEALERLNDMLAGAPVDLVLSDMAPNLTGMTAIDQPQMMELAELADDFAMRHLRFGGAFLTKLFQGAGFDQYVRRLRSRYRQVSIRKPKASRARSPEVYALAIGKRADRK
ncbi:MAG: RlmE family RNA methyltransferase [Rhodanobacteraceae bacterium]